MEPEIRGGHQSIANRNTVKHSLQIPESSISRVNSDAELANPKYRISVSFQNSGPGVPTSPGGVKGNSDLRGFRGLAFCWPGEKPRSFHRTANRAETREGRSCQIVCIDN